MLSLLSAITAQFTTFRQTNPVSNTTFQRRLQDLIEELMHHPHKKELLRLMSEQLQDDTFELATEAL